MAVVQGIQPNCAQAETNHKGKVQQHRKIPAILRIGSGTKVREYGLNKINARICKEKM